MGVMVMLWNRMHGPAAGRSLLVLALAVVLVLAAPAAEAGKGPKDFCKKTAQAAFNACRHEVKEDYWIIVGHCRNIADDDERDDCEGEAAEARAEGNEECADQREGRREWCEDLGPDRYDPEIAPASFVDPTEIGTSVLPNEYLPLIPGTEWIYEGGDETITVTVTDETREIMGVTCVVVRDIVEELGEVIEDTKDWYAQDVDGNVWYFGEISFELEDGEIVSLEGSWEAGEDFAEPGILMHAVPMVGQAYRQEFLLDEAEDVAQVTSVTGSETVPAASCSGDCVVTLDVNLLEPDAEESKYYAPDIGVILEIDSEGVRVELVSVTVP